MSVVTNSCTVVSVSANETPLRYEVVQPADDSGEVWVIVRDEITNPEIVRACVPAVAGMRLVLVLPEFDEDDYTAVGLVYAPA